MKLYYIFHSGFAIVAEDMTVIVDFYEDTMDALHGIVHDVLLHRPGRLYVLATHFHPDHFNHEVLSWKTLHPDIVYLFSKDILRHHRAEREDAVYLKKGDRYDDGMLQVQAFGSTDSGDSFYLSFKGVNFFHAGDLNNWHWSDESTLQEAKKAEGDYLSELRDINKEVQEVDVVMFPIDRRIGTDYTKGAQQFLEKIKSIIFVPMHFGYDYAGGNAFQQIAEAHHVLFLPVTSKGECFDITELLKYKKKI